VVAEMVLGLFLLAFTVWLVYSIVRNKSEKSKSTSTSAIPQRYHDPITSTKGDTRVKINTSFSVNEILSKRVFHKSFGYGIVVDISDASKPGEKYLTVKFEGGSKKLAYPMVFMTKTMTLCDATLRERMEKCFEVPRTLPQASKQGDVIKSICTGNCSTCTRDSCIEDKNYKYDGFETKNSSISKGETKMKTGEIVYAKTHAEFLNATFGTNYKQWMKCVWNYNENTIVWMVRFNHETGGWRNSFVSSNRIKEENLEHALEWNGKSVADRLDTKRIVVEIDDSGYRRKYIFRGIYTYDKEASNPYTVRYYNKVSDEMF
jgi:hypothetical protein